MRPSDPRRKAPACAGFTLLEAVLGMVLMAFAGLMAAQTVGFSRTLMFETGSRILEDDKVRSCMNEIVMLYNTRKGSGADMAADGLTEGFVKSAEAGCPSCGTLDVEFDRKSLLPSDADGSYGLGSDAEGSLLQVRVSAGSRSISRLFPDRPGRS